MLSTNEWKFPDPSGRSIKAIKKQLFGNPNKEITIVVWVMKHNTDDAMSFVSEWEVLLRRTTIYLCTWAEGIVSPKVLRKYIGKGNRSWIKLYRYIWLKSQSNHLCVPPSPKTFALLATCVDCAADESIRRRVIEGANLPAASQKDAFRFTGIKGESTIIVSDLPLSWKSNLKNLNDIPSTAGAWGWNNLQHYAPNDYSEKADYLIQSCRSLANVLGKL